MNLAQRFERRLESLVGSAFARVFKGQVEPVEVGAALQREAGDQRAVMGAGQVMVPNRYRVTLSTADYERLVPWEAQLANAFAELVQDHIDENGWMTLGDIEVYLAKDESLHTGIFGVASRMESDVPPRQRPHDSLSLPMISADPAYAAEQYGQPEHVEQYAEQDEYAYDQSYQQYDEHGQPIYAQEYQPEYQPEYGHEQGYPAPPVFPPTAAAPLAYGQPHIDPYGAPVVAAPYSQDRRQQAPVNIDYTLVVDGLDQRYRLHAGSNIVGRGQDAHLRLADQGVSRRHLEVYLDGNGAVARDLGSTNGSSVNGHTVSVHNLQHGDVIRIGNTRLVFQQETG